MVLDERGFEKFCEESFGASGTLHLLWGWTYQEPLWKPAEHDPHRRSIA